MKRKFSWFLKPTIWHKLFTIHTRKVKSIRLWALSMFTQSDMSAHDDFLQFWGKNKKRKCKKKKHKKDIYYVFIQMKIIKGNPKLVCVKSSLWGQGRYATRVITIVLLLLVSGELHKTFRTQKRIKKKKKSLLDKAFKPLLYNFFFCSADLLHTKCNHHIRWVCRSI